MISTESQATFFFRMFFSLGAAFLLRIYQPDLALLSVIGSALFLFFCLSFFYKLGKSVPVRELIIVIALLQWVIGPILSYHFFKSSEFYYMSIDENSYMDFIVPATFFLIIGLFLPIRRKISEEITEENPAYFFQRGRTLLVLGFAAFFSIPFVSFNLQYFFILLSHASVIGAYYILKSNNRYKYLYLVAAFLPIIVNSTNSAVFHELFIWGGFTLIMITFINKSSFAFKIISLLFLSLLIFTINTVKSDFREIVWADAPDQITNLASTQSRTQKNSNKLMQLVGNQLTENNSSLNIESDNNQNFVDRINQGWIISRIMYVVPKYEPFAHGETIREGIYSALLPRIVAENKATSGGFKNFERFTGLKLNGASMNLGIVGEAYANYGENGGFLFMFIYGLFFNLVYTIFLNRSQRFKEYLLWLPFIFFYVIKAEDDFTGVFNQFIKSMVVMILLLYVFKTFFKVKPVFT